MKKYVCKICGYGYRKALEECGIPFREDYVFAYPPSYEGGIAAGTAFEDIPEDWACPLCGVGKDDFEPVE